MPDAADDDEPVEFQTLSDLLTAAYTLAQKLDVHIVVAVTSKKQKDRAGYVLSGPSLDPTFRALAVATARWLGDEEVDENVNAIWLNALWHAATPDDAN